MPTSQPAWKLFANIGDAGFAEHGGSLIYIDETGVYPPELEHWDAESRRVYRFDIERLKEMHCIECRSIRYVEESLGNRAVHDWGSLGNDAGLPHPAHAYGVWYFKSLPAVASCCDWQPEELLAALMSEDLIERAMAYESIAHYHGFENFDQYPLKLKRAEAEKRYAHVK